MAFKLRYQQQNQQSDLLKVLDTTTEQSEERGLILCNKTDYLVWAATGIVREDFESAAGTASTQGLRQVINSNLDDKYYFYYAEAVTETGRQAVRADGRFYGRAILPCAPNPPAL